MQYKAKSVNHYYIVFGESKHEHWFIRLLPPSFQHVLAVRDDGEYWTIINPLCSHIDTRVVLKGDCADIVQLYPNSIILSHKAVLESEAMTWCLGINSCVDVVKRVIGLRAFWVWTPRQLFKRLSHG
jgi:hypothetical protein